MFNEIDRGGGLIFGGPDGTMQYRLRNGNAFARYGISPNARMAACVTCDDRTLARWVTFFDSSGAVVSNVMLPAPPKPKLRMRTAGMKIFLSNHSEAVVSIGRRTFYRHLGRQEDALEWYYVLPSGTIKRIKAEKSTHLQPLFPDDGGVIMLRTTNKWHLERPWHIERYEKGLKLLWKKTVRARSVYGQTPKYYLSLHVITAKGRYLMHFHSDGRSETEPVPAAPSKAFGWGRGRI